MTNDMRHADRFEPLSEHERARLRPTVDSAALERFLAAAPAGFRRFYALACSTGITEAEDRELGLAYPLPDSRINRTLGGLIDVPALSRLWAQVEP